MMVKWVRRDLISGADALSKFKDIMNFGLSQIAFHRVCDLLGTCDIDAFAALTMPCFLASSHAMRCTMRKRQMPFR